MLFGVNLYARFTHKSVFFADVHKVDTPHSMTYAGVVSRYIVWMIQMLSVLYVFDVNFVLTFKNGYLNAKSK